MRKQFALLVAQFVHISAIRRCFLNVQSSYMLEPVRNEKNICMRIYTKAVCNSMNACCVVAFF